MKQLQIVFSESAQKAQKKKELVQQFNDALRADDQYQTLLADLAELKGKKKEIEQKILGRMGTVSEEIEELKNSIKEKKQAMTDLALTNLMAGKKVEVKDGAYLYEPVWSVRFKKAKIDLTKND